MQEFAAGDAVTAADAFVRRNPELMVAAVAAVLVTLGSAYLFVRLRRPAGETFRQLLADRDEIAVLMHPNPDPDAMAAAIGVVALADQLDVDATIQYPGQIRHQENRAFQTVLDLDLNQIDHVVDIGAEDVVLVDHNEPRGFTGSDGILPFAVVDHHPGDGTAEEFIDVRTDYGATASIVAEYFKEIGADPVPPDWHASETDSEYTLSTYAATGLLYGILTDTKHLTVGADPADFAAAGYLYAGVDEDLLDRIANPLVDAEVLEIKARAIASRHIDGSFAVSDVGIVNNVDAIPQAADELIQMEGVTAVVIIGERDDTVYLSGRSRDDRVHMGKALQAAVEDIPKAGAGGHARMGGGQIDPEPGIADGGDDSDAQFDRDSLEGRLFRGMSGDV